MLAARFNLIYQGEVHGGYEAEDVKQSLTELFELDDAAAEKLFSGDPITLRENLDAVTAETFQKALSCVGAITRLEAVQTEGSENAPRERRRRQRRVRGDRRAAYRGSSIQPDRRIRERRTD